MRFRVEHHATVTSTNELARAAAERGEPPGLWILAREQRAGRGRQGRSWLSPPGNFYGSLLLRPRRPLGECATLSLVAALAVAEAVEASCAGRVRPTLKWPNDVLVAGAKLAGILPEAIAAADGSAAALILGIGVNLAWHPEDLGRPATSLRALGEPGITPETFLAALEGPLSARLESWEKAGFTALRETWCARAVGLGEPVQLVLGQQVHTGRLVEVAGDGSVLLETADGRRRFTTGELFLAAAGEAAFASATEASSDGSGRL